MFLCLALVCCLPFLLYANCDGGGPHDAWYYVGDSHLGEILFCASLAAALIAIPLAIAAFFRGRVSAALGGACLSLSLLLLARFIIGLGQL